MNITVCWSVKIVAQHSEESEMKLHEQRDALQRKVQILEAGLNDLLVYINSEKFWDDNTVNVRDIELRIQEVKLDIFRNGL